MLTRYCFMDFLPRLARYSSLDFFVSVTRLWLSGFLRPYGSLRVFGLLLVRGETKRTRDPQVGHADCFS
jgi:hypothetical protein